MNSRLQCMFTREPSVQRFAYTVLRSTFIFNLWVKTGKLKKHVNVDERKWF